MDERVCAWLAELMQAGAIPDGCIDNRSITEVQPEDLKGFLQCHFFAGIGVDNRVVLLRGAGNAIVPPLAAEFIKASEEAIQLMRALT